MAKLISKTYGEALFELALEEKKIDLFLEEVEAVKAILMENQKFNELMKHPKIAKEEKLEILCTVFQGRISTELMGFFTLIVEKDRYQNLNSIFHYFIDKVKEEKGIGIAYISTAVALKEIQKKQIEEKLLQTTTYQKMELHFTVKEELIGGMLIRIGDRVVDSSIATKLKELEKQLLKLQMA